MNVQPRRTNWTAMAEFDEPMLYRTHTAKLPAQPQDRSLGPVSPLLEISTAAAQGLAGVVGKWLRARTQPTKQMRLVETLTLGPKRSVALLEINGQQFLAGMGADGVSTLLQVSQSREDVQF